MSKTLTFVSNDSESLIIDAMENLAEISPTNKNWTKLRMKSNCGNTGSALLGGGGGGLGSANKINLNTLIISLIKIVVKE
jgi:hypothetical protein